MTSEKHGPSFAEFVVIVSLMMSLTALSIDAMLPALPQIGSDLSIESVEMKFQAVTLKQITNYLHLVESSPKGALVRRLSMSRVGKEKFYLDVVLLVETLVS